MRFQHAAPAYATPGHDRVREALEAGFFARVLPRLLAEAGGGAVLDLGCGDGLAAQLAGPALRRYTGVDFRDPEGELPGEHVAHDLRQGIGPVGPEPFDLYLATFGVASHLRPDELRLLLRELAAHARRGSLVALEALGVGSLEWPRLWETGPGPERSIPYRLGADVEVHPWAPSELAALYEEAGIRPLRALDRTVQAGPKVGEGRYWPGLPPLRCAINALLEGGEDGSRDGVGPPDRPGARDGVGPPDRPGARDRVGPWEGPGPALELADARRALVRPLSPLPAGPAAALQHSLTARRRGLVEAHDGDSAALARSIWALESPSGGGFGHGLLVIGRVA